MRCFEDIEPENESSRCTLHKVNNDHDNYAPLCIASTKVREELDNSIIETSKLLCIAIVVFTAYNARISERKIRNVTDDVWTGIDLFG